MAKELMKIKKLDEIWFSPAFISPFKSTVPPADVKDRLEMVRLAIQDMPGFKLFDREAKKEGPSYTVDILQEIVKENSNTNFFLIMSDETAPEFYRWKEAEEIVSLVSLLIGSRTGTKPPVTGISKIDEALKAGWTPTTRLEISSTEIREKVKNKGDCSSFLPKKVLDYIYQNHLYY